MKRLLPLVILAFWAYHASAQVGINNISPNASLDIRATNQATPANNDGLLIPRIDAFPVINPTAFQNGMIVYLTTTASGNPPGFYYWNNSLSSWQSMTGADEINELTDGINDNSSVFLGNNSGTNDDGGNLNVGIGNNTLTDNTSGIRNVGIGWTALFDNTTGDQNVAIGYAALQNNTTGRLNTAIGATALGNNTTGEFNVGIGIAALSNNLAGDFNTAVGSSALSNNLASNNTAVGYNSLQANAAGTDNSALGYFSLRLNSSGSNNVAIGTSSLASNFSGDNNTAVGRQALTTNTSGFDNTAIGNQVGLLNTTGYQNTAVGSSSLDANTTGNNNTAVGYSTLGTNNTGRFNTALGSTALGSNINGIENTAIGYGALASNTQGAYNVALGNEALSGMINASYNIAIGRNAISSTSSFASAQYNITIGNDGMSSLTSGSRNIGIGGSNLENLTSGIGNVAVGMEALQLSTTASYNTAIGFNAGLDNATGGFNTYLGYQSGENGTTAANNTFLGSDTGFNNLTGSGNVFIGYRAGYNETGSDKLYLDNSLTTSPLVYGDFLNNDFRINGSLQVGDPSGTGYEFPAIDGTAGQVLLTNGAGNVSFGTLSGGDTDWVDVGANIERQAGDVYIGDNVGTNNDIYISDRIIDWDDTAFYLDPNASSLVDEIEFADGTNADPSIRFADLNTGFFSPGANLFSYSANGTESLRIQADGEFSFGNTTATDYDISIQNSFGTKGVFLGATSLATNPAAYITNATDNVENAVEIIADSNNSGFAHSALYTFNDIGDFTVDVARNEVGVNTFGVKVDMPNNLAGTEYGVYSDVQTANGFSGYFLGDVSIGTSGLDNYVFPASRGTNGQVMTTDATGNLSWTTISAGESTTASNGLTESGDDVQLGGTLTQATSITQGTNSFDINLNNSGDFAIQDNGSDVFFVEDTGDIGIGTSNPNYALDVTETTTSALRGINLAKTDNSASETNGIYVTKTGSGSGRSHAIYNYVQGSGTGQKYGTFNRINSTAAGSQYGVRNWISAATSANQFGVFNNMDNGGSSDAYGVYNGMRVTNATNLYGVFNEFFTTQSSANIVAGVRNRFTGGTPGSSGFSGIYSDFTASANGDYYGSRVEFGAGATGTGDKYGSYNTFNASAGGTHYGTYNSVDSSNGWAGYFLGTNYVSENIGIGNTAPDGRLDIVHNSTGATSPHIMVTAQNANTGSRIVFDNAAETTNNWVLFARADNSAGLGRLNFYSSEVATNVMRLNSNGAVGVMRNPGTNTFEVEGTASKTTAGSWLANSDSRLKTDIKTINGTTALDKINQMRGVTYFWNDDKTGAKRPDHLQYGFIAQELMEVFPDKVTKDNLGYYQTAYGDYDPLFVSAIKELDKEVDLLKEENIKLKNTVAQLNVELAKYADLEARIAALEGTKDSSPVVEAKEE